MQQKVWRARSSVDLAADVVEKVMQTGKIGCQSITLPNGM